MFASFVRKTSAATALLFAAVGLTVASPAAVTTQPGKPATRAASPHGERYLTGRAAAHLQKAATAGHRTIDTPFSRIMLPRIKAQQAKAAAESKANPGQSARAATVRAQGQPLTGPDGTDVNFSGFYHPSLITTTPTSNNFTDEVELSLTADVNKDGKPDLVTITVNASTLNVLVNTGTGLPATPTSTNTTAATYGPGTDWASAVDLNGDGYPDIELVDAANAQVYIWMNNGDGTFGTASQITLTLPNSNSIYFGAKDLGGDIIFADVTGDAKPDLIVLSGEQVSGATNLSVQVYAGAGDGTFPTLTNTESATLPSTLVTGSYHSLQAVDMNNDGKLDLVYPVHVKLPSANQGSALPREASRPTPDGQGFVEFLYTFVLTGDNAGNFTVPATISASAPGVYAVGASESIYGSYVGNVAGSGTPAVVIQGDYGIYSQLSNNDGTLQAPVVSANPDVHDSDAVNFADVTGDGKVDAVIYSADGFVSVYPGGGDGTFSSSASQRFIAGYATYQQGKPADFNGDGIIDIIDADFYSAAGLYLGVGNGAFKAAPVLAPPTEDAYYVYGILSGNLTGHGFADVLLYDANGEDTALLTAVNDGKGNFTYKTALSGTNLNLANWNYVQPVAVDVNNDQKPDLIIVGSGGIYAALNNGDGTFAVPVLLALTDTIACETNYVGVADINNDGKPDMVFPTNPCAGSTQTNAGYYTLLNNGGTFPNNYTETFTTFGNKPYQVRFADFNKDGNLDLIIQDESKIFVAPGVGDGTFNLQSPTATTAIGDWEGLLDVQPVDFDVDGKEDIAAFGNLNGFGVALFKGDGDFTFEAPVPQGFGQEVYAGVFADFNGDGLPDLAVTGYLNYGQPYEVGDAYLVNLGGGTFSSAVYLPSGYDESGWDESYNTPILLGDFNGDGAMDFIGSSEYTSGIFFNTGAITMALTTSSANAAQDSSVTLTVTLTPTLPGTQATGTVTFYDNGVAIGTATVSGNVATLNLTSLPVGTNVITAVYSGDANYNGASSTASVNGSGGSTSVGVTALPAAFTMTAASGATLDLTVGQTGTATFTLTGNATFSGAVSIACSGVPQGTSCAILPSSTLTLAAGQSTTFGVVLDTTAPNNHYNAANFVPTWMKTTGGITLAGGLLLLLPSRRRRQIWPLVLFATLGLGAAISLSGCSHKYEGTPAGTYTVNVTATSGSITQTAAIALTIHK